MHLLKVQVLQRYGDKIVIDERTSKELDVMRLSFEEFGIQMRHRFVQRYTPRTTGPLCDLKDHELVVHLPNSSALVITFDYMVMIPEPRHLE